MELKLELNIYKIFLYIIIILNLRVFYLVDYDTVPLNDICIIVEALFFGFVYLKNPIRTYNRYKYVLLFVVILAITSSIAAYYNYAGQPFFMGFRAQRHWIVAVLMYFPITKLLKEECLDKGDILAIVDNTSIVLGIIVLIQVLVGTSNVFLYVNNNTRYGNIRLYVLTSFLMVCYFHHLYRILSGEIVKIKDILVIGMSLYIVIFVAQSRMGIVTMAATTIIMVLSGFMTRRRLLILVVILISACIYLGTDSGTNLLDTITGNNVVEDTSEIRDAGRAFYIQENTETVSKFIFGSGFANSDWPAAFTLTRQDEGIGRNDNGVFGLFYYYGFIYVIWMAVLYFRLIRDGRRYGNRDMAYYLIFGLFGLYTLDPGCYVSDISFAIVCALIDFGVDTQMMNEEENTEITTDIYY